MRHQGTRRHGCSEVHTKLSCDGGGTHLRMKYEVVPLGMNMSVSRAEGARKKMKTKSENEILQ